MAWATRGTRKYYYRNQRTATGIVTEYLGKGRKAEEAARQIEERRQAAVEERSRLYDEQAQLREVDVLMRSLQSEFRLLLRATLTANGYHQSTSREWRKKRRCHGRHSHDSNAG